MFTQVKWKEKQKKDAELKWIAPKRDLSKPFSHKRDISRLSDLY